MSWRSESPFTVGFRAYVGFWFHCSPNPTIDSISASPWFRSQFVSSLSQRIKKSPSTWLGLLLDQLTLRSDRSGRGRGRVRCFHTWRCRWCLHLGQEASSC
ncbi:hypothetical protein IPC1268_27075 [Pseudomonas aeruginosa]|nr:hypothetical protein IPC1268_27075 [Pseudomonas aeruginosa]TQH90998.1 hypothetical protein FLI92_24815 [Pseudomonas aeruginosa]TQI14681.1 hypothetical protein FLI93_19650 [Pseudomonas aeruginosa]